MFIATALLAAATPGAPCVPIPGWEEVVDASGLQFLVVGEIHGTREMPEAFSNIVCLAARRQAVVVALEFAAADQSLIDEFMQSSGDEAARNRLLSAQVWTSQWQDGRSSAAMFALLERLRQMVASGMVSRVRAIQPTMADPADGPGAYEVAMAGEVTRAREGDAPVVVLVGNAHAMDGPAPWRPGYLPMAANLPQDVTLTVNMVANGGGSWNCTGQPITCGPSASRPPEQPFAHGITRTAQVQDAGADYLMGMPFDATLFLGTEMSASPPQRGT